MAPAEGIGSDGPTEEMVHKMLERMGDAGIERLKDSDALIHRGRQMPKPEDFEPPPPPAGPAKQLSVNKEGTGFLTYEADDSVEIIVHTTESSSLRLRAAGGSGAGGQRGLLFHVGWPGVPPGWHHAVQLMRFGEVSSFAMAAEDAWGPPGGPFEALLEGPRPAEGSSVEVELELQGRAEGFFPASVLPGQSMPARYWIRRGPGSLRPGRLDHAELHLAAWAACPGALCSDAPHIPRGEPVFDSRTLCKAIGLAVGEGAVFEIMEHALLNMHPGDTARLLLEAGVPSSPEVFGEAAPEGLRALAGHPGPLEFEILDFQFEAPEDPNKIMPAQLQARVLALREQGNARVKQGLFERAVCWYEKGLEVLDASHWQDKVNKGTELDQVFRGVKVAILNNLALCLLQSKSPALSKAVDACSQALEIEPNSIKAMFRKGKALVELREYVQAEEVLTQAAKLEPKDAAIRQELAAARKAVGEWKKSQRSAFGGMFDRLQGFAAEGRPEGAAPEEDDSDQL